MEEPAEQKSLPACVPKHSSAAPALLLLTAAAKKGQICFGAALAGKAGGDLGGVSNAVPSSCLVTATFLFCQAASQSAGVLMRLCLKPFFSACFAHLGLFSIRSCGSDLDRQ